ncbi:DUF6268 family outer membrane beta-barrel protein [Myroides sp. LJL119]
MKITVFIVAMVLFVLLPMQIQAQHKLQGHFKADYVPFSNYIRPIDSVKTASKSDFKKLEIAIDIPLSFKLDHRAKPRVWSLFAQGAYAKMAHKKYEEPLFPTQLLNAQFGLKHLRSISPTWSMLIIGSLGIYTDLQIIDKQAILGQGGVFFIKHFNPQFSMGIGPVLTNSFGVPMVLPGLYLNWETFGDFFVKIAFPENIEAGYKINNHFNLKAAIDLQGMTAMVRHQGKSMLLGHQQIIAGLRPELKVSEDFLISLTAGSTLVRSISVQERKIKSIFKEKKIADPRFATTLYAAVVIKWKL